MIFRWIKFKFMWWKWFIWDEPGLVFKDGHYDRAATLVEFDRWIQSEPKWP